MRPLGRTARRTNRNLTVLKVDWMEKKMNQARDREGNREREKVRGYLLAYQVLAG